jgi:hypothetical protein|tara:strand:- start:214 stop:1041 length:828 start_codon:yes stop_codon:yes gene_type:complete
MITKTTTAMILFGLIAVIGFGNAYAETPDRVTVDSFPFEITILEGGELTIVNTDDVTHTFDLSGQFSHNVGSGEAMVITLPDSMTADNADGWYLLDKATGGYNIVHTEVYVEPYVAPPQPVYVAPVIVEPVYVEPVVEPTPVVVIAEPLEERVDFGATSNATIGSYEGITNVATFEGSVDAKALQKSLADVTANFNSSVEKIAEQKSEIELLNANALKLTAVDTATLDALQANNTALSNDITAMTADRDEWKALAENWYGVAMSQLKVMVNILGL